MVYACPEQLAGLSTPRDPAEIEAGKNAKDVLDGKAKVVTLNNVDVTQQFIDGANKVLVLCRQHNIKIAILRENSPSYGVEKVYSGKFEGNKISGNGITTELLRQKGITVYNEYNFPDALLV